MHFWWVLSFAWNHFNYTLILKKKLIFLYCELFNGIVEKKKDPEDPEKRTPKKGNLFSSWNATCEIEKTFNINYSFNQEPV